MHSNSGKNENERHNDHYNMQMKVLMCKQNYENVLVEAACRHDQQQLKFE